ncbi:MAG: autotransporter assembly complex protein TamA [Gemmatimonadales bacterium]
MAGSASAQQPPGAKVRIEIVGVEKPVARNVRAMLELARAVDNGYVTRARVGQLHQRAERDIGTALEPYGYYRPEVEKSLTENGGGELVARYVIDPGPAVVVRTVKVELEGPGKDNPAFVRAAREFPLEPGDTLRHLAYEAGKLLLLTMASDSGYLDADFDSSAVFVDRDRGSADIVIRFETGERFRFGHVTFEQTILDSGFLRKRIPFRQGDLWTQRRMMQLQTGLAEDPFWARVEVMPEGDSADGLEVPVRVVLEPNRRKQIELGAGYGTDTGPRGRASALYRWLNRSGHQGLMELRLSTAEQSFATQYTIPGVGHSTGNLAFAGGYARRDLTTSRSRMFTGSVRLNRGRLGWRESMSLVYHRENFGVGVDTATATLLMPGLSYERTRKEAGAIPRRGITTRAEIRGSMDRIVSSASLLQVKLGADAVYGFFPKARVLVRSELGYIWTGEFRELPPTVRFFTGGDRSVRGFRYQGIGARDSLGNIIGGRALVVGSLEVDYEVIPRWALAVFTDAGSAEEKLTLKNLDRSVGAGIRWFSILGPIRLDVAVPVSRNTSTFRIHLSLGPDL